MGDNSFHTTVESLFKGMDSFISAKTVVGEAIHVGDTIILPLMDVSFGVGAGAFSGEKKDNGGGGSVQPGEEKQWCRWYGRKDHTERCVSDPEWNNQACQHQKSGWTYQSSGYGSGFCRPFYLRKR